MTVNPNNQPEFTNNIQIGNDPTFALFPYEAIEFIQVMPVVTKIQVPKDPEDKSENPEMIDKEVPDPTKRQLIVHFKSGKHVGVSAPITTVNMLTMTYRQWKKRHAVKLENETYSRTRRGSKNKKNKKNNI